MHISLMLVLAGRPGIAMATTGGAGGAASGVGGGGGSSSSGGGGMADGAIPRIRKLDETVINRIAAGEVAAVDR